MVEPACTGCVEVEIARVGTTIPAPDRDMYLVPRDQTGGNSETHVAVEGRFGLRLPMAESPHGHALNIDFIDLFDEAQSQAQIAPQKVIRNIDCCPVPAIALVLASPRLARGSGRTR